MPGRVILLNGASSSGKSSVCYALQDIWDGPLLHVGIDDVIRTWPTRHVEDPAAPGAGAPGATLRIVEGAGPAPSWIPDFGGPMHDLLARAHRNWASLAADGWDLVVDHVLLDDALRADALEVFADAFWVGLHCPVEVAVAREASRGDRYVGFASGTSAVAHRNVRYDLEVDGSSASPAEVAAQILAAMG